jgi:holo-[acyl-carrier protein] synthase
MIKGIGVDIIDIPRVQKMVDDDKNNFVTRVFTENEIKYCQTKHKKAIHFAARFAAKEAFFKALGTGWRYGMKWQEISVENDELGKPEINLSGQTLEFFKNYDCQHINLSISHTKEYAVAFVVIE